MHFRGLTYILYYKEIVHSNQVWKTLCLSAFSEQKFKCHTCFQLSFFYWNLHSKLKFFILSLFFFGIIALFGHISNENQCKKLILSQFFILQKVPKKLNNQRKSTFGLPSVQASHFGDPWIQADRGTWLFLALKLSQNSLFDS